MAEADAPQISTHATGFAGCLHSTNTDWLNSAMADAPFDPSDVQPYLDERTVQSFLRDR